LEKHSTTENEKSTVFLG